MKTFRVWLLKRKLFKRNLLTVLTILSLIFSFTGCADSEESKLFVFCNDALYSLSINDQMQIEKTKITDPVIKVDKGIKTKYFCLSPETPFFFPISPDGRKIIFEFAYRSIAFFYPCFTPDSKNIINLSKICDLKIWSNFMEHFVD